MTDRPPYIKHWREIQHPDDASYPGSKELLSIGSNFGKAFGMQRVGFHHELLPPGRRTSWPHCERTEDEFVFVIEGTPDAWIDAEKTKVGYEIPFNRHFYVFKPPRPLAEIDAELKGVTDRILTMINGLTA